MTAGFRNWSLGRVACGLLTVGYPVLWLEVYHDHRAIARIEPIAWAPVVTAAVVGLCLAIGVFGWGSRLRWVGIAGAALSLLVGLVGLYLHNADRLRGELPFAQLLPPLLAPLAFSGLGAMALLFALWPTRDAP